MAKKIYRVRDKSTGKFWTGGTYYSTFNDSGYTWKKLVHAEASLAYYARHRSTWKPNANLSDPANWEIVEFEIQEIESTTSSVTDVLAMVSLKTEADTVDRSFSHFIEQMRKKNVLGDIEFIFKLKKNENEYRVTSEKIKEARAQLRQLGVKTRTFKEFRGMFGMMDRQQAMKARLVLDVDKVFDLAAARTKFGI